MGPRLCMPSIFLSVEPPFGRLHGEGGIRTPGGVTPTSAFEADAFNRARPPLHCNWGPLRCSSSSDAPKPQASRGRAATWLPHLASGAPRSAARILAFSLLTTAASTRLFLSSHYNWGPVRCSRSSDAPSLFYVGACSRCSQCPLSPASHRPSRVSGPAPLAA